MSLMSIAPRSASVAPLRRGDVVELRPADANPRDARRARLPSTGCRSCRRCSPTSDSASRSTARVERAATRSTRSGRAGCRTRCCSTTCAATAGSWWVPGGVPALLEGGLASARSGRRARRRGRVRTADGLKTLADAARSDESANVYRCQATEFVRASSGSDGGTRSPSCARLLGNVSLGTFVRVMARIALDESSRRLGLKSSRPFARPRSRASSEPETEARRHCARAPRRRDRQTLDGAARLRGPWFDREMLPYCGTTAQVKTSGEAVRGREVRGDG